MFCQQIQARIDEKNSQVQGDDDPMANGEAHVVLHCLVFPVMEVGGDQAGGQAGGDGDEEVEAKGFVNVKFTGRRC